MSTTLCMRKKKAHAGWVCTFFWLAYIHCAIHTCKIKIKRKESVQKQDSVLRLPSRPLYTSRSDSEDVAGKQDVHDSKQIIHDGKRRIRPSSLTFSLSEVFCTVRKSIDASRTAHSVLCKRAQSFVTPPQPCSTRNTAN